MPQIEPIDDNYIDEVIKSAEPYNQAINKTQGVKLRELIKKLRDYFEEKISGSSGITEVTYDELSFLILNNGLSVAQQYILSDYKMHWKVNSDTSYITTELVDRSGIIEEPLVLIAISSNRLSHDAKSLTYPEDDIKYMVGVFDYQKNREMVFSEDSYNYNNINPVRGYIYKRTDNIKNCAICYDFRSFWVDLNVGEGTTQPYFAHRYFRDLTLLPNSDAMYAPIKSSILPISYASNSEIKLTNAVITTSAVIPKTLDQLTLTITNSNIEIDAAWIVLNNRKISFDNCNIKYLLPGPEVNNFDNISFNRVTSNLYFLYFNPLSSLFDLLGDETKIKLSIMYNDDDNLNYKVTYLDEVTGAIASQSTTN